MINCVGLYAYFICITTGDNTYKPESGHESASQSIEEDDMKVTIKKSNIEVSTRRVEDFSVNHNAAYLFCCFKVQLSYTLNRQEIIFNNYGHLSLIIRESPER